METGKALTRARKGIDRKEKNAMRKESRETEESKK